MSGTPSPPVSQDGDRHRVRVAGVAVGLEGDRRPAELVVRRLDLRRLLAIALERVRVTEPDPAADDWLAASRRVVVTVQGTFSGIPAGARRVPGVIAASALARSGRSGHGYFFASPKKIPVSSTCRARRRGPRRRRPSSATRRRACRRSSSPPSSCTCCCRPCHCLARRAARPTGARRGIVSFGSAPSPGLGLARGDARGPSWRGRAQSAADGRGHSPSIRSRNASSPARMPAASPDSVYSPAEGVRPVSTRMARTCGSTSTGMSLGRRPLA